MKLSGAVASLYLMGFDRVLSVSDADPGNWFPAENAEFQMMKQFSFSTPTISPTPRKTSSPTTLSPTEGPTSEPTFLPTFTTSPPTKAPTTLDPTFLPTFMTSPPTKSPTTSLPTTTPPTGFMCPELETQDFSEYNKKLVEIYSEVSFDGAFIGNDRRNADRRAALNFVRDERLCASPPRMVQRYISALFYFSTNGENWNAAEFEDGSVNWLSPEHECEWEGLKCTEDQVIDKTQLDSSNLSGTIPFEICKLPLLKEIDLDDNEIGDTIPSNIGQCKNLRVLDLDNNQLVGSIPDSLFNLDLLEILDIDSNNLTGTLSSKIGRLTELKYLSLFTNGFTGTIPGQIANLVNLEVAYFDANDFTGTISNGICKASFDELTADCGAGQNQKVECDCCTNC